MKILNPGSVVPWGLRLPFLVFRRPGRKCSERQHQVSTAPPRARRSHSRLPQALSSSMSLWRGPENILQVFSPDWEVNPYLLARLLRKYDAQVKMRQQCKHTGRLSLHQCEPNRQWGPSQFWPCSSLPASLKKPPQAMSCHSRSAVWHLRLGHSHSLTEVSFLRTLMSTDWTTLSGPSELLWGAGATPRLSVRAVTSDSCPGLGNAPGLPVPQRPHPWNAVRGFLSRSTGLAG